MSANVIIRNGCHWANKGRQMIISECLCKKDVKIHLPKYQCLLPFNKQSHFFFLWGIFFESITASWEYVAWWFFSMSNFDFNIGLWFLGFWFFFRHTHWRLFFFKVSEKDIFLSLAFSKLILKFLTGSNQYVFGMVDNQSVDNAIESG